MYPVLINMELKDHESQRKPKFVCSVCGKVFMKKYNYRTHMGVIHKIIAS